MSMPPPAVKDEDDIECLYARKMAAQGPFHVTRSPNCAVPFFNKTGHWSDKENAKYYAFLKKFRLKFEEKEARRQWKVFKTLADFVKTRNPNQCRSHHHKMQKNFQTVEETLDFLRHKIPSLEDRCKKYEQQLEQSQYTPPENDFQINLSHHPRKREDLRHVRDTPLLWEEQQQKKEDRANAKTKDDYDPPEKDQQKLGQSSYMVSQDRRGLFGGFPSTGLLNCPPKQGFPSFTPNGLGKSYSRGFDESMEQKWAECHHYFLRWISKLNSLVAKSERDIVPQSARAFMG